MLHCFMADYEAAGTGEQEVESDTSDTLLVPVSVIFAAPIVDNSLGYPLNVHCLEITTGALTVTVSSRGFADISAEGLIAIAQELCRTATSRMRDGSVQIQAGQ